MPFKYNPFSGELDQVIGQGAGVAVTNVDTDSGSAVPTAGGVLDVLGGTGVNTAGAANTVTINLDSPVTAINGGTEQTTYAVGDILYASAVNTLSKLPSGSDTEVLTLASGVPSWAASAGGSGWVHLSTATASASAFLSFDNTIISSTYDMYALILINFQPATSGSSLMIRTSNDNGSTWHTTGYESFLNISMVSGGSFSDSATNGLHLDYVPSGQVNTRHQFSMNYIVQPTNASYRTGFITEGRALRNSDSGQVTFVGSGSYSTAEDNDAIQIVYTSGNITVGTARIYGISNS